MAINRLQASLAQATNEVTVAAANVNFDFTLVKCEAPKEYQLLGNNLSRKRKQDAELGSAHVTARRLGALFEGVCPSTPKLLRAYGSRASEIAEAAAKKTASDTADNSIFAAHSGVDGTSIWAAATSSITALHVQLLACMLARLWSAPEATATWVELVKERRKEIASRFEDEEAMPFSTLTAAAQSDIPRSQLADWDASARAWLRMADSIKPREQQQLMLILANVNVPVNNDLKVLSSVITAWASALESMERLIGGMPQAVSSGPTLLALSSWHLYPDLLVVGHKVSDIQMRDPLVAAGGALTIGLGQTGDGDHRGVYWSLSLAHLRHYGHPVQAERRLGHHNARVTFAQFTQAVFGCLLGNWSMTGTKVAQAARFFIALDKAVNKDMDGTKAASSIGDWRYLKDSSPWLHLMVCAAYAYLDTKSQEHSTACKLVNLGLRRSSNFIETPDNWPFFGLSDPKVFLRCLKGPEERIAYLRLVASRSLGDVGPSLLIRYYNSEQSHTAPSAGAQYATAVPLHHKSRKREHAAEDGQTVRSHHRWLLEQHTDSTPTQENWTWRHEEEFLSRAEDFDKTTDSVTLKKYLPLFGDPQTAAIFTEAPPMARHRPPILPLLEDLECCFQRDAFSLKDLLSQIERGSSALGDVVRMLKALSIAAKVYNLLPEATVAISALYRPLYRTKWATSVYQDFTGWDKNYEAVRRTQKAFDEDSLGRHTALSCVAYLESGFCDIEPSLLTDVIALSSEDSLYISMQLLCDPYETPQRYELKRILGNVGRAGITMLVPPHNPMTREKSSASWKFMRDGTFNGRQEDHFDKTSLHLSFTDYHVPLFDGISGGQDSRIFLLESVVSIYDSGVWVGDVDILGALNDRRIHRMAPVSCDHRVAQEPKQRLTSVECWDEVLDPPKGSFVVRASDNWTSRLAVTAMLRQSLQKPDFSNSITICPRTVCWICNDQSEVEVQHTMRSALEISRTYIY